jgi:hypothetical protein
MSAPTLHSAEKFTEGKIAVCKLEKLSDVSPSLSLKILRAWQLLLLPGPQKMKSLAAPYPSTKHLKNEKLGSASLTAKPRMRTSYGRIW